MYEVECEKNNPDPDNNKTPWDEKNPRWTTRWSTSKTGQLEFSGWLDKGLKKFQQLIAVVKKARHSKEGLCSGKGRPPRASRGK